MSRPPPTSSSAPHGLATPSAFAGAQPTVASARPGDGDWRRARIGGVDVARGLAIIGMVMVHFGPYQPDTSTWTGTLFRSSYGRASVLFTLLAGVGVTLLFDGVDGRRRDRPDWTGQAWLRIGWRAVILIPLGLALGLLDTPVAVILHYYAGYYVVGAVAARLPSALVAFGAVAWAVLGGIAFTLLVGPEFSGRGDGSVLGDILLTGYYPLITWAPPVLVGVLLGRTDLRDTATAWAMLVGGAVIAGVTAVASGLAVDLAGSATLVSLLSAEGHSGAPLNIIGATGAATAVLGACLLVGRARILAPLVSLGQLALTVYVGHLLVMHVAPSWVEARSSVAAATISVLRFSVIAAALAWLWQRFFQRGPLEWVLAVPFKRRARPAAAPLGTHPSSHPGPGPWTSTPPRPHSSSPPSSTAAPRRSPPSTST